MHTLAGRMAGALRHRGPDDGGVWVDAAAGYAVGFRRLAIVDLTPEGHQPMLSQSGRFVIAFNGEVYNYQDLRQELLTYPDIRFRGHSDTEVMLAAIETWGLGEAVRQFAGMFAFALWDCRERTLHLVRDRLGEKPLYYGWIGRTFFFGSELKAFRAHPQFRGEVRRDVLIPYLRHNCIPAPHSIYRHINKLLPGTLLTLRPESGDRHPAPVPYWSVRQAAQTGTHDRLRGPANEIVDQLEQVLRRTIGEQMIADVPLGAFLSGGVDSSAIVALMQAESARPVRTFTIGFHDTEFNEAEYARAVAHHLETEHTELYVSPAEVMGVIPRLPRLYDEPFADSSQIPTFLVAQMARQHVTVSLSGDGGDEAFAGYTWYARAIRMWNILRVLPPGTNHLTARALGRISPTGWDRALEMARRLLPAAARRKLTGDRVYKLADILTEANQIETVHRLLISDYWKFDEPEVRGAEEPISRLNDSAHWPRLGSALERLQCFDMLTYLPDDILVKVDRASMAVSLEARAPFLDHRVLEFLWRVPPQYKVRAGQTKWLLRQVLYRHVPPALIERPKQGFAVPLRRWLAGPLRDWAETLLDPVTLAKQGFFNARIIRRLWDEQLSGRRSWDRHLWSVLMFQAWLQKQE
jgi:asparagine synthase (glutamine-hydrolysing)